MLRVSRDKEVAMVTDKIPYKENAGKRIVKRAVVDSSPLKRTKQLYYRYDNKEDRLAGWANNRAIYEEWRFTDDGREWVDRKRRSQLNKCFICLTELGDNVHVDHIFPLYLGGTNNPTNLCIAHPDCNMRKGAKVYMTYKQACNRRAHFNKIRLAINALRILEDRPGKKPSKNQSKNINYLRKHIEEPEVQRLIQELRTRLPSRQRP